MYLTLQKLSQILSYTQRFSVSPLTFYKVLLLTPPNINLIHCDDLNSPTLFPSIADEVLHNCSALTGHLRTLCVDLQEIPLGNASFMVHWCLLFKRWQWWLLCQACYCNSFWCCWGSSFTYNYFCPTGWIIPSYTGLYFSQQQNCWHLY